MGILNKIFNGLKRFWNDERGQIPELLIGGGTALAGGVLGRRRREEPITIGIDRPSIQQPIQQILEGLVTASPGGTEAITELIRRATPGAGEAGLSTNEQAIRDAILGRLFQTEPRGIPSALQTVQQQSLGRLTGGGEGGVSPDFGRLASAGYPLDQASPRNSFQNALDESRRNLFHRKPNFNCNNKDSENRSDKLISPHRFKRRNL
jgi:hypothetical protein